MTAAMSRGAPVSAALVAGAVVVLAVVGAAGASLGGEEWWAVLGGAFACASGLVLGMMRRAVPAAGLALIAVFAGVVAAGDGGALQEAAPSVRLEVVRPATTPAAAHDARGRAPVTNPGIEEGKAKAAPPAHGGGLEALVRSYYAALDAHEYATAWRRLSPSVQAAFGGFEGWRLGYGTTVGHRLEDVRVDGDEVALVLVATDRTPCGGTTEQRFSVQWRLEGRIAVSLTAVKLGGLDPASACG